MRTLLVLAAALAALAAAGDGHDDHDATVHHRFEDPEAWAKVFDDPARDAWQKPEALLASLGVEPGMTVADLGAGTGYFSVRLARAVGAKGRVLALDVEPGLVDYMKARAAKDGLPQVQASVVPADDPRLPPGGVDLVLIVDTWHHLDDRIHYIAKLAAGLKPGGRVAVVDFKKGDLPVGPPDAHKLPPEAAIGEFEAAGWRVARRDEELLPYQYVLAFAPPASPR